MANLYMLAATNEKDRQENSIQSVLAIGADEAAARAAVVAARPNGGFDLGKFASWSAYLIAAGTITLPVTGAVQFLGKAYGVNPMPGQ